MELKMPVTHIERDQEWIKLAQQTYKIQLQRKKIQEKEDLYLTHLKKASQGISSRGGDFVFTRTERKGIINYKDISEIQGILKILNLELYRSKSSESWKLARE